MLTRSIDLDDPFAPTLEEKIFVNAKRLCIIFAVGALTLSALDLMNVRSVENASEFIHDNRSKLAELPRIVAASLGGVAFASPSPEAVIVPIPDGDIALALPAPPMPPSHMPSSTHTKHDKAVTELSAARHEDAVEVAMAAPAVMPKMAPVVAHEPPPAIVHEPPAAALPAPAIDKPAVEKQDGPKLASLNADAVPPPALISPPPAVLAPPAASAIVLPTSLSVLPPPAPGVPPPSPAQRLHLEGAERAKAERCLANAIYFEARDQPYKGQVAVAQVVMNRVFSGIYPRDVCGVIYQNANRHLACQFTFACDGKRKVINEFGAWARARRIAKQTLDGQLYVQAVGTATHYHATYVHPNWVHEMHRLAREGIHWFYRPWAWGNGSNEPVWSRGALANAKAASLTSTTKKR